MDSYQGTYEVSAEETTSLGFTDSVINWSLFSG